MRNAFIKALIELAEKDENIYLLTSDVGYSVLEGFIEKFPERFINCGVAEQNIMGLAAGLALAGKKPYIYSIIPFVILRCLEQLRNDICYQNLDVKIVPTGAGLTYGALGLTHFAIEDISVLRAIPNITILCPADPIETRELVLKSYQTKSPTFIRLYKGGEKTIYESPPNIEIGQPSILRDGKDGVIIAIGLCVGMGIEILKKLKEIGYDFKLISFHTLKPIDKRAFLTEVKDSKAIFTIEEHNIIGGLGTAVAGILMEAGYKGIFKMFGLPDKYFSETGDRQYLNQKCGLTVEQITKEILTKIK